jgi:hypothetical protein
MNRIHAALALAALSACGTGSEAVTGLPIALVTCPASGTVGVPFEIDATASHDDEGLATIALAVDDQVSAELRAPFTVDYAGIVSATLTVTDPSGNTATATCRFLVEDVDGVDDPAAPVQDPIDPADDPAGDPVEDPVASGPMTGAFAMVAYDAPHLVGGSLSPVEQCAPAPSMALVQLAHGDGELTMTLEWCRLEMPDVQINVIGFDELKHNEIPDTTTALLGALGPATFPFDGTNFAPPLDVFGRALVAGASNEEGPLPNNDFASNVTNPDGDAHNGVPILVGPDQFNVALRRKVTSLGGTVTSTNEIDGGAFTASTEVSLLDFGLSGVAQPSSTALSSRFKMTRIEGDGASCADLIARESELFAALPSPAFPAECTVVEQQ